MTGNYLRENGVMGAMFEFDGKREQKYSQRDSRLRKLYIILFVWNTETRWAPQKLNTQNSSENKPN